MTTFENFHRQDTESAAEPTGWTVHFGSSLYGDGSHGSSRPGRALHIDRVFRWGNEEWHIPAVYLCGGGVVVDLCARVDRQVMEAFRDKWVPRLRAGLTEAEQETVRLENPMSTVLRPSLTVNGKILHRNHGSSDVWCPVLAEAEPYAENSHARRVLEHYGLDLRENWSVHRISFPWADREPSVRSMLLTMTAEDTELPGIRFTAKTGDIVSFTHPVTGGAHRLTVLETEAMHIPIPPQEDTEHPSHCTAMEYAVWPDMEPNAVFLRDCCSGDPPRRKTDDRTVGGAFGIIRSPKSRDAVITPLSSIPLLRRNACSSLYFQPPQTIEWQICFRAKLREDQTEILIE